MSTTLHLPHKELRPSLKRAEDGTRAPVWDLYLDDRMVAGEYTSQDAALLELGDGGVIELERCQERVIQRHRQVRWHTESNFEGVQRALASSISRQRSPGYDRRCSS